MQFSIVDILVVNKHQNTKPSSQIYWKRFGKTRYRTFMVTKASDMKAQQRFYSNGKIPIYIIAIIHLFAVLCSRDEIIFFVVVYPRFMQFLCNLFSVLPTVESDFINEFFFLARPFFRHVILKWVWDSNTLWVCRSFPWPFLENKMKK